jgi:hypothetical protein
MLLHHSSPAPARSFAAALDRRATCVLAPGWLARLGARLRGAALDGALIEGADPAHSPQLAARAAWLTTPGTRAVLARGLDRLLGAPSDASRRRGVLAGAESAGDSAPELRELAGLLRGPAPVYARGVAMLWRLLADGTGPAYTDREGAALASELVRARIALGG